MESDEKHGWDPPLLPSESLRVTVRERVRASVCSLKLESECEQIMSRTELDSHANMIVIGKHSLVIARSGKTIDVGAFADEVGGLSSVPIVDAMVAYDCPRTNQVYLLIARNALYVESMDDNLIPPFILREVGITVNEKAKQHCEEPTDEDHAIIHEDSDLLIPLRLRSIFSYFETREPTARRASAPPHY